MEEYLKQFLDHLKYERNVSDHTLRNYASDLEQFYEFLTPVQSNGARREVTIHDIDHHITYKDTGTHRKGVQPEPQH